MSEPTSSEVLSRAREAVDRDGRAVLCQIVRVEGSTPGKPGWKLLVERGGEVVGNLGGGAFEGLVKVDARRLLEADQPKTELKRYYFTEKAVRGEPTGMVCGGMAEVFLEVLTVAPVLLICGGGPVGQALARAGDLAGFDVAVVEDRPEFRRPELFPEEAALVEVGRDYGGDFLGLLARRELFVAVVTRCWETDAAALSGILRQSPPSLRYLGLMGSRRKVDRVRDELDRAGLSLSGMPYHAPIGLPLGGPSPGEIAISIVAQLLQVRYGRAEQASEIESGLTVRV